MLNAPTDNLYKFCATFGLIVIFSSSYYTFNKDLDLHLQENNLYTETRILKIQVDTLNEKVKYLEEVKPSLKDSENLDKEKELEYQKLSSEYKDNLEELEKITEEKIGKESTINIYKAAVKIYYIIFILSLLVGVLLSVFGFYNWYKSENK